ncbi:hypothetical protein R3P38DRAFT_3284443 [Favolaschia claudopus]|uniref:Uncharacterized protein n=1 Tax=Favolaschia claudopus TaxID=2862362 RepID=A0AAW0A517_9AGAR
MLKQQQRRACPQDTLFRGPYSLRPVMPLFSPPFSVLLFHDVQAVVLYHSQARSVAPQDDSRPLPSATPLRISDAPVLRASYTRPPSTTRTVVQRTPSGGLSVPPPPSHHPDDPRDRFSADLRC